MTKHLHYAVLIIERNHQVHTLFHYLLHILYTHHFITKYLRNIGGFFSSVM